MTNILALDDDSLDLQDVLKRSVIETVAALDALLRFIDNDYRKVVSCRLGRQKQTVNQIGNPVAVRGRHFVN